MGLDSSNQAGARKAERSDSRMNIRDPWRVLKSPTNLSTG